MDKPGVSFSEDTVSLAQDIEVQSLDREVQSFDELPQGTPVDKPYPGYTSSSGDVVTKTSSFLSSYESSREERIREAWNNKWSFILSIVGYTVAYGNMTSFPSLCLENGGGAFLIPYLLFYALIGTPLLLLNAALGQFCSRGSIGAWNICPLLKGIGLTGVCTTGIIGSLNAMSISTTLYYFFSSLGSIRWKFCGNEWNTPHCVSDSTNNSLLREAPNMTKSPTEEFYEHQVLGMSSAIDDFGGMKWGLLACNALTWLVVLLCIARGMRFVGKTVYLTSTFPFLVLSILLLRGISLPGSSKGYHKLFTPDWDKLGKIDVWNKAAEHTFYSLGVGMGGILTMASFNRFNSQYFRYVVYIPLVDIFASLFSALVTFPFLGYMSEESGLPIERVITSGPAFLFVVFPTALTKMPFSQMWSLLFFCMLFFIGMSVQIIGIYAMIRSIVEELPKRWRRKEIRIQALFCGAQFVIGILYCSQAGIYMMALVGHYVMVFSLLFVAALQLLIVGWVYGADRFLKDMELMGDYKPCIGWKYMWQVVTPLLVLNMYVNGLTSFKPAQLGPYKYPAWAQAIGMSIGILMFLCVPLYAIYAVYKEKSGNIPQRILKLLQPDASYRPQLEEDHKRYIESLNKSKRLRNEATEEGTSAATLE